MGIASVYLNYSQNNISTQSPNEIVMQSTIALVWHYCPSSIPILIVCSENIGAIVATNPKNSKNYVASQSVRGGGREWKHPLRTFQSGPLARKILGVKKHKLLVKT